MDTQEQESGLAYIIGDGTDTEPKSREDQIRDFLQAICSVFKSPVYTCHHSQFMLKRVVSPLIMRQEKKRTYEDCFSVSVQRDRVIPLRSKLLELQEEDLRNSMPEAPRASFGRSSLRAERGGFGASRMTLSTIDEIGDFMFEEEESDEDDV